MNRLPDDPMMLMSVINMKLRDFYPDLEALCDDMQIDIESLTGRLEEAGFKYCSETNRFM